MFSQTEFRFYWLNTKLGEQPELSEESKYNPVGDIMTLIILSYLRHKLTHFVKGGVKRG